jgi:DNA-binding transcriptional MerR regulator
LQINYDINLDIKILHIIKDQKDIKITISDLRNYLEVYQTRLEEHLTYLVKWGIVSDSKPKQNGMRRVISIIIPYSDAMIKLNKMKEGIETVNEYF